MLLNHQWVTEEIRGNKTIPKDEWKWKCSIPESMRHSKRNSKMQVYSNTSLPQETRKITNKQSNLTPKGTRKKNKQNPKLVEGRK